MSSPESIRDEPEISEGELPKNRKNNKPRFNAEELSQLQYARVMFDRSHKLKQTGQPTQARDLAMIATRTVYKHYGKYSREYARCLNLLARIDCLVEDYKEAEKALEAARAIMATHPVEGSWGWVQMGIDANLALAKSKLKKFNDAESLYQEILKRHDKAKDTRAYAITEISLGNWYLDKGDYNQAEKYIRQSYLSVRKHATENEPIYIGAIVALGKLNLHKKEYAEAEKRLTRAHYLQQAFNGKSSFQYADIACYLSDLHAEQSRVEPALSFLRKALAVREKALGKDHPLVLKTSQRIIELQVSTTQQ
ncbi:MAG: tetratricopeptide repeat protein [Planctomycetes bacterium]|nr:tetratricopeptide repeat protein [Planctomycetota bacterium]